MTASKAVSLVIVSKLCTKEFVDILRQRLPNVLINQHEFSIKTDGFVREGVELINEQDIDRLKDAKVIIADNNLIHYFAYSLPKLEWLQGTYAGVNVTFDKIKDQLNTLGSPKFVATRFTGERYGQLMHEYCLSYILSHERGFREHQRLQPTKDWTEMVRRTPKAYRLLSDLTVTILGLGAIGREVSKLFRSSGISNIFAYSRTEKNKDYLRENGVDKFSTKLTEVLADTDYIVSILPHTPETIGLLDGQLKHCTKKPVLINLGRGSVVSEDEIVAALNNGFISLAVLDVFQKEPLPDDSKLWTHPGVAITPHIAAVTRPNDLADVVVDNYKRYVNGQELKFQINWQEGY